MFDNSAMQDRSATIHPFSTLNEVMALHPLSIHVLNAFGVDTCCGGAESLAEAARIARVDVRVLIKAIAEAGQP